MFKSVKIKNFQSLKNVQIDLEPFTVIVGATDSGKSAFFRALSTLISNRRGADFITHGEKICQIEAELDQGHLKLQRGKGTSDNFYEIQVPGHEAQKYTKLSGTVPEEVTKFIGISAKDPIQVASQFDKPYLLDTKEYGPSETARILGALTNVNVIFEGARESNRQKTQANSTLKTRELDLESANEKIAQYSELDSEKSELEKIEADIQEAEAYDSLLDNLDSIITQIEESTRKVEKLNPYIVSINLNTDEVESLFKMYTDISTLIESVETKEKKSSALNSIIEVSSATIVELNETYDETLRKAGTCPMCGQATH